MVIELSGIVFNVDYISIISFFLVEVFFIDDVCKGRFFVVDVYVKVK